MTTRTYDPANYPSRENICKQLWVIYNSHWKQIVSVRANYNMAKDEAHHVELVDYVNRGVEIRFVNYGNGMYRAIIARNSAPETGVYICQLQTAIDYHYIYPEVDDRMIHALYDIATQEQWSADGQSLLNPQPTYCLWENGLDFSAAAIEQDFWMRPIIKPGGAYYNKTAVCTSFAAT